MSGRWGLSLSERLDRDGPESTLRKGDRIGGEAKAVAVSLVALHDALARLRSIETPPDVDDRRIDAVVAAVAARAAGPLDAADDAEARKAPLPDTDEEVLAMAEYSSDGSSDAAVGTGESARISGTPEAPAVRRGAESDKTSSGVINLKALADDYYRQKSQRAGEPPGDPSAGTPKAAAPARKRMALPALVAVAFGMVAVAGVLAYYVVAGSSEPGPQRRAASPTTPVPGPALSAAAPSAAGSGSGLAGQQAELERRRMERESAGASAEEIDRLRHEIEMLKAQRSAMETVGKPGEAAGRAGGADRESARSTARDRPAVERRAAAEPSGPAGAAQAQPPVSPTVAMLGGGRADADSGGTSRTGSRGPAPDAGRPPAPEGRVTGSLEHLLGAPPTTATSGSPPAAGTSGRAAPPPQQPQGVASAPPPVPAPPAPPGEALPDIPSRPDIRRATDSVKAAVLNCGAGQTGTITVQFTVSGTDGRVTDARVSGEHADSAVGACAERAARAAVFPRFQRATFTMPFPFVLPAR